MDDVIGSRPLAKATDALQGVVPGLLANNTGNAPGKGKSLQIRGAFSIGSNSQIRPLVLIDNVEGDIDMLNPNDIESVTVLKDAASAAVYGARAAGGVVLVTTKRPKGKAKFQLNYNNNIAFASAVNLPKQASLDRYLQAYEDAVGDKFWTPNTPRVSRWRELLAQYRANPSSVQTYGDGIFKDTDGAVYYLNEKDLVKNMLETSFQHTHNLSATGATETLRYRISAGYTTHDGVLITSKDKFERKNINVFLSADLNKWFTQEVNFGYANSTSKEPRSEGGGIYSTRLVSFYPEGTMPKELGFVGGGLPFFTPANQLGWANTSTDKTSNPRIFLKSILKPIKGLEVNFEYTYDRKDFDHHYYSGSTLYTTVQYGAQKAPENDHLDKYKRTLVYNAINLYANYAFKLNENRFKLMVGFNQESHDDELIDVKSYGQIVTNVPSLAGGTQNINARDAYDEFAVRGAFFRVNYSYMDRYLFEANGRYDGSSKFPKNSRFGFFPSVSAAWNVAEEAFMAPTRRWLDGLKLRASYGMIGNQNVPNYAYIPTMSVNNKYAGWLDNGTYVAAINSLPGLVSQNFTWEKAKTLDFGLDVTLFGGKLNAVFDWYQRRTDGMLAPGMELPAVFGTDAPHENTADMRTNGWELALNWQQRFGEVGLRAAFNISDNTSRIIKYNANEGK